MLRLKYFLFIFLFLFTFTTNAYANDLCSETGYTILTINGIFTDKQGAIKNSFALGQKFKGNYNNQILKVDFLYNPSHLAGAGDLIDAVQQGLFDQKSDYDLVEMLNDASQKVTTQKLLLVAHSQGNFYANNFYDKVASQEGGVPKESIGVYGVASPANRVAGKGKYLTSDTDNVIASAVARYIKILSPNIHIPLSSVDGNGHSFSDVYLKYQGDRVVSDIKSLLDKLHENDEQLPQDPCISPPELTIIHKIQGAVLAVADPTAIIVKDGIVVTYNTGVYVATGIYNTSLVIGNATINVANTLASGISSVAQSLFNNTKSLAINNTASVISAVEQSVNTTDTSQNTAPEIAKENSKSIKKSLVPENVPISTQNNDVNKNTEENTTTEIQSTTSAVLQNPQPNFVPGTTGGTTINPPPPDTTAPIISIVGDISIEITKDNVYTDAGATALDNVDGNLTSSIVKSGTFIDTTIVGTYTVIYTATDLAGNISTLTRTVNVVAPDTTAPNVPTVNALPQFINTNNVVVAGTAEANSTVTITGGTSTATGVATDGNFSISVLLNQNILNTLNVTATDAANNTSNPATVSTTHDNLPPVINYLDPHSSPAAVSVLVVGATFYMTISADATGYTASSITINGVPIDTFVDNRNDLYTVTHKVTLGEQDRSVGNVPVSVVLTDAAGNSNDAYTETRGNSLAINGHYPDPASVAQVFPFFDSDGTFTQDVVLPCVTNSGYFEMYYVRDFDSIFRVMNLYNEPVLCPGGQKTVVSSGMGFANLGGYPAPAETGWYYGIVSIGNPKCDASKNDTVCVNDNIQSFFRLHRSATGVWSDTDI